MGSRTRHEPTVARVALSVPESLMSCGHMTEPVKESSQQDQTGNETTGRGLWKLRMEFCTAR